MLGSIWLVAQRKLQQYDFCTDNISTWVTLVTALVCEALFLNVENKSKLLSFGYDQPN